LLGGLARGPATRLKRPLLAELVFMLDRWLQRLQGIFEYTHKPDCLSDQLQPTAHRGRAFRRYRWPPR
jgi:hypothetical protein